jgi:hypothetical protein
MGPNAVGIEEPTVAEAADVSEPVERRTRAISMATVITMLYGFGGFALAARSLGDNSFLWHLRTGDLIIDQGIPRHDPFSFTAAGTRWIAQSWLAELMYAALRRSLGAMGIRIAVGLAGAWVAIFLFRVALHATNDRVRALALGIPALACSFAVFSERPLMFGLALLGVVVFTVEVPESFVGRHPRVVIPIAMWLWVNVHGSFSLGFLYLAVYLAARWIDGSPPLAGRERGLVVGTAIAAVLVFVNPYGPRLVLFPVALMGRSRVLSNVIEWQSVDLHSATGFLFAVWVCITLVALARSRPTRGELLITLVFLFLGWWAVRNVAIAVAVTIPIIGRAFRRKDPDPDQQSAAATPLLVVVVLLVGALLIGKTLSMPNFDVKQYPTAALRALDAQHRLGGRLLTTDAWAGYVIYKYWPEQHVFFDDRYDMYPVGIADDYNKILSLKPGWEKVLDDYKIDTIVWPKNAAFVQALRHLPGWKEIRHDKVSRTFIRT